MGCRIAALLIGAALIGPALLGDTLLGLYNYTSRGGVVSFVTPPGTDYIVLKAWGAGGAGGFGSVGGGGGYITSRLNIAAGQSFSISVGEGGHPGGDGSYFGGDTWDHAPYNGGGPSWVTGSGGQGGGYTLVQAPGGATLIAGGGGGGSDWNAQGFLGQMPFGGGAGQAGGGANPGSAGSSGSRNGSAGAIALGGGGGGGWQGGSGGGNPGGGGGGTSGADSAFSNLSISNAYGAAPGNSSDPDISGAATGGGSTQAGGGGLVVIRAYQLSTIPVITSALTLTAYPNETAIYQITAANSPTSYGFSWSGAAGGSTNFDSATGRLTLTPTVPGQYTFQVTATNVSGPGSAIVSLQVLAPAFTANPSATPSVVSPGAGTVLIPNGTAAAGLAWIENSLVLPNNSIISLGNQYGSGANVPILYTPLAGPGIYTYIIRVVDVYYNYEDAAVAFTVAASVPVVSWTPPAPIVYGTPLSAAQLNATASVPGTFTYSPAAGAVPGAGTQSLTVTFIPNDVVDYVAVARTVSLQVAPAAQTVSVAPATAIALMGTSITFTAAGGFGGYIWAGNAGAGGSGLTNSVNFPSAGIYTVTVQSPAGTNYTASNIATATVNVTAAHVLSVTATTGGTATGGGLYADGSTVQVQASAGGGYIFAGWSGPDVGALSNAYGATATLVVSGSQSVTARFVATSEAALGGTIDFGSAGIPSSTGNHRVQRIAVTSNLGNSPLELRSFAVVSGGADFSSDAPGGFIAAGNNIVTTVAFAPQGPTPGARTGRIIAVTTDATNPIVAFDLTGNAANGATAPTVALTLTSLATIFPADTVALNVEAASTSGNILFYDWRLVGPGFATVWSRVNGPTPVLRASHPVVVTAVGQYYFEVNAVDDSALSATGTLSFDVVQGIYSRLLHARAEPSEGLQLWFSPSATSSESVDVLKTR